MLRILVAIFLLASPALAQTAQPQGPTTGPTTAPTTAPVARKAGAGAGTDHTPARETVVAGLSQNRISITANFDGTGILIFGAVKRTSPPPAGPLDVIIAVSGPERAVTVRKKERIAGIWVNRDSRKVSSAPTFYAIASTGPLSRILSKSEDMRYKITIPRMVEEAAAADGLSNLDEFATAVIRIRKDNGLYVQRDKAVKLSDETLFDTQIALPAALVEGDYKARIFLLREGKVLDAYTRTIAVRKVGMERWIYNLAHERPLIYGLLSLAIAIFAGWLASTVFRLLRIS